MSTKGIAERLQFAYWVPNVSGGLVTSNVEQRTDWGIDYNVRLARHAEEVGFDYALTQVRYLGSYGANSQHESVSFSLALLTATERLKVIAAVHPGFWQPGVLANLAATASEIHGGRFALNVVSGWLRDEYIALGEPWLAHQDRYERSAEFLQVLRKVLTEENVEFAGDHYRIRNYTASPRPAVVPELFQGGTSTAARRNGGLYSDWYFTNGAEPETIAEQVREVREHAESAGREVKIAVNGFVILEDTEKEAKERLREIVAGANTEAVDAFRQSVKEAGASTGDGKGMWADSSLDDLVQYNDGFKTKLIGTREQIEERIEEYRKVGVDLVLTAFLHFDEELQRFGREIIGHDAGGAAPSREHILVAGRP